LACGPCTGTRARVGLGRRGGGGVRGGDELELGDDRRAPLVSGSGEGEGAARAVGPAGPAGPVRRARELGCGLLRWWVC
jgi:hypothetical protein